MTLDNLEQEQVAEQAGSGLKQTGKSIANKAGNKARQKAGNFGKKMARKAGHRAKLAAKRMARKTLIKTKQLVMKSKMLIALIQKLVILIASNFIAFLILVAILLAVAFLVTIDTTGTTGNQQLDPHYDNPATKDESNVWHAEALVEPQALKDAYYKYMACQSYRKYVGTSEDDCIELIFDYEDEEAVQDFAGLSDYYEREDYFYLSSNFILYMDQKLHQDVFYFPEQVIKPVWWEFNDEGDIVAKPLIDEDGKLIVESGSYEKDTSNVDSSKEVWKRQSDTEKRAGVWDYGAGSVLQYDSMEVDQELEYNVTEILVEQASEFNDEGWVTGSELIWVTPDTTVDAIVFIPYQPATETSPAVPEHYESYSTAAKNLIPQPTEDRFHMRLVGDDIGVGKRIFNNSELNSKFGNGGTTTYPIKVPLITSAGTFSGNISYTYEIQETREPLEEATSADYNDPVNQIVYENSAIFHDTKLTYKRDGEVIRNAPVLTEEKDDPWGFDYLISYTDNYNSYVPDSIKDDLTFEGRINDEMLEFLKDLGLLVPYGGSSAEYNPFMPSGLTLDQIDSILQNFCTNADYTLHDAAQYFWDMEQEYGVNALFAMAVSRQECGLGNANTTHVQHNNFFSFKNTSSHPGSYDVKGTAWEDFDSKEDSIMFFASKMTGSTYYGKTLYAIGNIYCPNSEVDGQANGWVMGVMNHMYQWYDQLGMTPSTTPEEEYENQKQAGAYLEGMEGVEFDPDAVKENTGSSGTELENPHNYTLYKIRAFDVRTATMFMQKTTTASPDDGLLAAVGNLIGGMVDSFLKSIKEAFDVAFDLKSEPYDAYEFYSYRMPKSQVEEVVFQSVAANEDLLYSTVEQTYRDDGTLDISFLFVGKKSGLGEGTFESYFKLEPGVGCTIEGFQSPTDDYYSASSGWSASAGGIVLATPEGTNIKSVGDGTVVSVSDTQDGLGKSVVIEYVASDGSTYRVTYGYLGSIAGGLAPGDKVSKGQIIGQSGKNPATNSPGFFFGLEKDGEQVNPTDYFYQSVSGDGPGFYDLVRSDGSFDMDKAKQLNQRILSMNWFYETGRKVPTTDMGAAGGKLMCNETSACASGAVVGGVERRYDKYHAYPVCALQPWQCTWWANGRASEWLSTYNPTFYGGERAAGLYPTQSGHGGMYYDKNVAGGWFEYGRVPKPFSVVSWKHGSGYGHVAFVEAVNDNGDILISHAGSGIRWYGLQVVSKSSGYRPWSSYTLNGFIYLDQPK